MKYKCQKCGFIHIGDLKDGYYCPLCGTGIFDFKEIESDKKEINYKRVYVSPDNPAISRIDEKCIDCGACANTCINTVNIRYKNPNKPICINCGQCVLTCPTGALVPKYDYNKVLDLIDDQEKTVIVMTSPAVRVALGDAFDFKPGEFVEGKMVAALKKLGFKYVVDTTFGADLTSMEEAAELKQRIDNDDVLPMFTSCCPSWVKYAAIYHPNILPNLSTCKTPIGMGAIYLKKFFAKEKKIKADNIVVVALTPCTAKKYEIENSDCDYVITTSELALALRENNIDFKNLENKTFDELTGSSSGTIYGTSGGVLLSALRTYYYLETGNDLTPEMILINNKDFYKEYVIKINTKIIKAATVYQMGNLEKLLSIKNEFVFIEVMNCNYGCIGGGGQIPMPIINMQEILKKRSASLLKQDKTAKIRYPYKNPIIKKVYDNYLTAPLSKKSMELLHTKHKSLSKEFS
ncbi:MAG: [Fe-Fe] hydrogenase large subunit C-terminal domain-containing protein [Bacilli bacterium]|nr:[Fe-Fe] hydrogenase large subunit C-terminal domain-containing protein [Bacilli bacterium]